MLNDGAVSAQAVLVREKYRCLTEITLHVRGERFLHGVGDAAGWEPSLTEAIDKLAQQAKKLKGKREERKRVSQSPGVGRKSPVTVPKARRRPVE